jgi:uncharacterized protein (TIGR00725 family)
VIGKGYRCPPWVRRLALAVGAELARLHPHVVLVNGGLGGVMDASARGMTQAGGVAIGLIPTPARSVSKHLTYALRLGLPVAYRDITNAAVAEVLVVLPGSHGTLIEGWAGADRGTPLVGIGEHHGYLTEALPFSHTTTPHDLAPLVARLLGLPR